jgi:hypothetical protein
MSRLFRWAINCAAAVSALLFLGAIAVWVLGHCHDRSELKYHFIARDWYWEFSFDDGWFFFGRSQELTPPKRPTWAWGRSLPMFRWEFMGMRYRHGESAWFHPTRRGGYGREQSISIRIWTGLSLLAILPVARLALFIRAKRRRRLLQSGCCPACGYDLRATPDV